MVIYNFGIFYFICIIYHILIIIYTTNIQMLKFMNGKMVPNIIIIYK